MKNNWFLTFLLIAICIKFIFCTLAISFLFAFILGFKIDKYISVKALVLGIILGIESAIVLYLTTALPGLSVFLNIFRSLGLPISDSVSYSTVLFLTLVYIVVFEIVFISITARLGQLGKDFFDKRSIKLNW